MPETNPPPRVTAHEFINRIKQSEGWALDILLGTHDIRLHTRDGEEIRTVLSPDQEKMPEVEFRAFLAELKRVSGMPEIARQRMF